MLEFQTRHLEVAEDAGVLRVPLVRTGDLGAMATVTCSTRALTARGSPAQELLSGSDYQSRLAEDLGSRVMFAVGSAHASCDVRVSS